MCYRDARIVNTTGYTVQKGSPVDIGEHIRRNVILHGMSVTEAADRLGVGRPALSKVLNGKASLSSQMALRLQREFGANRQELLALQEGFVRQAAMPALVPRFLAINARQISQWAGTDITARDKLPVLLRRLIHSTGKGLRSVDFPGGDNAQRRGWDGQVDADSATPSVPAGASRWELSTQQNPKAKADRDYAHRLKVVPAAERATCTFVFVTPHDWPGKNHWARNKEAFRDWKEVRALDASDLEQWLEGSDTATIWLAEQIGRPVDGIETLDHAWSRWADASEPRMTAKIFEPTINMRHERFARWLQAPGERPFTVAADSKDEALAFLACLFQDDGIPAHFRDEAVVVRSPQALQTLAALPAAFIPIVLNEATERELVTVYRELPCLVVRARNAVGREPSIALERLGLAAFEEALADMGIKREEFERLSRESGRSPTILRRRLSELDAIQTPPWVADTEAARSLIPLVLVGAWYSGRKADRELLNAPGGDSEVLAALADVDYAAVERVVARLQDLDDSPIWSAGQYSGVVSKVDALFAVSDRLTAETAEYVRRFLCLAKCVLSEDDPELDLPEDERWRASLHGKVRDHSDALRDGMRETLVLLAVHGAALFPRHQGLGIEAQVSGLIRRLLTPLMLEKLQSHNRDLPDYAEAAPDEFLTLLEEDLKGADPVVFGLLQPANSGIFSRCPRTGLLWALETLAWNPLHLARVSRILARLSRTEIDDNWANKPIASLKSIYQCWLPQTAAPIEDRISGLELLVREYSDIGWQLCIDQLEPGSRTGTYSHRPRWRGDAADAGYSVARREISVFIHRALELVLEWPEHNSNTLGDLVRCLDSLTDEQQVSVWGLVDDWSQAETDERAKADLREQIRRYALSPYGRQKLPVKMRDRANAAYSKLAPRDPVARHAWLFGRSWVGIEADDFTDGSPDFNKHEVRVTALRMEAMAEIWAERGLDGAVAMIDNGSDAHMVGWYAARSVTECDDAAAVLRACLSADASLEQSIDSFMHGFLAATDDQRRVALLLYLSETATADQKARLLRCAPFSGQTWQLLDEQPQEVRDGYWRGVQPHLRQHSAAEINELIDRLLEIGRPRAAFQAAMLDLEKIETSRLTQLLRAVASSREPEAWLSPQSYDLEMALDELAGRAGVTSEDMASLELLFLPALEHGDRGTPHLERQIEASPMLFVQALAYIYRRSEEGQDPPDWSIDDPDELSRVRRNVYRLLDSLKRIPGTDDDGVVHLEYLLRWVTEVRRLCRLYGRAAVGDVQIGTLLSQALGGADPHLPCRAVCEVIEGVASEDLAQGFEVGARNARGVHERPPSGDPERALASKYERLAREIAFDYPFVSRALQRIAASYFRDAGWEDDEGSARNRLDF